MRKSAFDPLLVDKEGHTECLLGNEAIVRGALEAGVAFACGYPGTPSSEVTDSFSRISKQRGIVFEYSINEKVALEMAFAASLAGARSICAMKHLGLMYAGDPLSTIPYIGTRAGMLIISAGDPSCRTSPNEQDQRLLTPMLFLPMLDPSTPQEAYEMSKFAFDLSEKSKLPVVLRPTTRVCHSRAVIKYGKLLSAKVHGFERDPMRLVPIPANARKLRVDLKTRIEMAETLMAKSGFLKVTGSGKLAILASGAPAATCWDVLTENQLTDQVKFISLGCVFPLPEEKLVEALRDVQRLLIVEELSPYLEDSLRSIMAQRGLSIEVLGKTSGHFPIEFEYQPEQIHKAIHQGLGLGSEVVEAYAAPELPIRAPSLCPGCPHRASQFALRSVFGEDSLYFNDIGCYTLGYGPPLNTADSLLCMGAGFSLAAGVSRVTKQRTVGIMGDSTFFHSGMPALLNAIKENVNCVAVILDNQVTAMTGFQESPTMERSGDGIARKLSIEAIVRSLGTDQVETVDPYDLRSTMQVFERARNAKGVSVVICERSCGVHLARQTGQKYKSGSYQIDQTICQTCGREDVGLRCGQTTSEAFERHMVCSQIRQVDWEDKNKPQRGTCSLACPLGICIQGFIGHIAAKRYRNAFEMIMEHLPMPETVCRVCHRPCEQACVREEIDQPVAINDLKRFVVEWAHRESQVVEVTPDKPNGMRVAVIGAGPAGLSAAYDLRLRGFEVSLFDAEKKPGGLLRYGIPAYRLPRDALDRDIEHILSTGIDFRPERVLGKDLLVKDLIEEGVKAVFMAIGANQSSALSLKTDGNCVDQIDALTYLKAVNQGLDVKTGKKIVVVGGGNAAIDAARSAIRQGAQQVVVAYRRSRKEMPAWMAEIEAAEMEGVEIMTQLQPVRIQPDGVVCLATRLGEPDESGRRRPVIVPDDEKLIEADQIIVAIGQQIDENWCKSLDVKLDRDSRGLVKVDPKTCHTSHPVIFSGGDMAFSDRSVTQAMAAGKRAAYSIDCMLCDQEHADRRPPPPQTVKPIKTAPKIKHLVGRQKPPELDPNDRKENQPEVVKTLVEEQALKEASRCVVCGLCGNCRSCLDLFGCPAFYVKEGRIFIDQELCMGCGVCAMICPNGAIREVTDE